MPLIEVHAPTQPATVDVTTVCRRLNAAVAAAIPCRLDAVWSTWRTIDGAYVRGDAASADDGRAPFGPIVHVFHHRSTEEVERAVEAIETVLSRELSINRDDVFVTTRPVTVDDPTLPRDPPDGSTAVT